MSLIRLKNHWDNNYGLYYILLGELFSSLMLLSTKLLEQDEDFDEPISPYQILVVRMSVTYIGCLIYLKLQKVEDSPWGPKGIRWALTARGISGFLGILGAYIPIVYLSLSDFISISFLTPLSTSILAFFILKESFSKFEGASGLVSLVGVLLIAKPTFLFGSSGNIDDNFDKNVESSNPGERLFAVLMSLVGVIFYAVTFILIRFIGNRADPVVTVSYYASITTVLSFLIILVSPSLSFQWPHTFKQWGLFTVIGICGFFLQYLFTTGLQAEKASRAASMTYIQIVFGILWEVLIWHHLPNIWSWLGIFIILSSSISVFWYKNSVENSQSYKPLDEEDTIESTPDDSAIEVHIPLKEFENKSSS